MADPNPLFTADDLGGLLGEDVQRGRAATVERIVWGRIKPALKPILTDPNVRPTDDETVFSIAVQIGAILYDNPSLLSKMSVGADSSEFGSQLTDLLEELQGYVSNTADGDGDGVPKPRGRFPRPQAYPDPARLPGCSRVYYR